MTPVYLNIAAPQSLPVGEGRPLNATKLAVISSKGLVVTADIPNFGKDDIGKFIYASDQIRTIDSIQDSSTVLVRAAFDSPLSSVAFTVVTMQEFTDFQVTAIGAVDICTPDSPLSAMPDKFSVTYSSLSGAIALKPGSNNIVVKYLQE